MINNQQLRDFIIKPTLSAIYMYSKPFEDLLVLTCANESNGGEYLVEVDGPALGIYQMLPTTHDDIWRNYLAYDDQLRYKLMIHNIMSVPMPPANKLIGDLIYATSMATVCYIRKKMNIPSDIEEASEFYKKYYNTSEGSASPEVALEKYRKFIGETSQSKPTLRKVK